ncbi:uncharacterized protein MELLADRAFT_62523 [Melampsora larici-populina 98AG31]|uniref:Uncharacterized protein n=1 Tax=Melampsora larici-populina (strain 98AG31 / pathotype 3-4-7) TaxID=747676 RepID=F4RJ84_MELLP|nr:uncharacterized protein MELLADRAFT_62523 [Melampsora larici-populina 98AG31]EGG07274.1 hypothetical protein MELLADRAFT_62523 [Melampsora larici-populina 98AG31]
MSESSLLSENISDISDQFSNFHLKDYDYEVPLNIYKSPPEHLKHKDWVQTDNKHDEYVFRESIRTLRKAEFVHLDYDLYHISYLLSVKNQPVNLKTSLQTLIADFQPPNLPPTVSTNQRLVGMAEYLLDVIEKYKKEKNDKLPFCLRYPTLESLEKVVNENEKKMKRVKYDHPVIFLDEAKRTIDMFIPPVKEHHIVEGSELACLRASSIIPTTRVSNPQIDLDCSPVDQHPKSPILPSNIPNQPRFETNSRKKKTGEERAEKAIGLNKDISLNFIRTGHGLCSTFNAHVLCYATGQEPRDWMDKILQFDSEGQVIQKERQGRPKNKNEWNNVPYGENQLPKHTHLKELYKQQEIASFTKHTRYWHIFNKVLNFAFTPKEYDQAEACIRTFLDNQNNPEGSNAATMTGVADHPNPAVGNVTVSLNSQPSPHRDPKDGCVMVSDVVHTNTVGGEFLMYEVGLASECENGSQIVGQFNILLLGIGRVKKHPNLPDHLTTRRTSLAIYSHHKIYEIAARYSALLKKMDSHSNPSLWLPLEDDQSHLTDEQIREKAIERVNTQYKVFQKLHPDDSASTSKDLNEMAKAARAQDSVLQKKHNASQKQKQKKRKCAKKEAAQQAKKMKLDELSDSLEL